TATWSSLVSSTAPPSIRQFHSAAYDSVYRRMIVFGGDPNVTEPTWALSLGQPTRWSPERAVIQVAPATLDLGPITVGDTASVAFAASNIGFLPLQVLGFSDSSQQEMNVSPAAPLSLAWNESVPETLRLVATSPETGHRTLTISSDDPSVPLDQVDMNID